MTRLEKAADHASIAENRYGWEREYWSPSKQKREWVGLTDEEIKKIAKKHKWYEGNVEPHLMPVFRSLEAKLRGKNS